MSTTGRFRSDLIAAAKAAREASPLEPASGDIGAADSPYANWLGRMQRTRGRHAAIAKNLYTLANYKSWTERVREAWEEDPTAAMKAPPRK